MDIYPEETMIMLWNPVLHLQIANLLLLGGTLRLLYGVYKDRSVLKGYDLSGSFLTFIATFFILSYLYQSELWISFWLTIVTLLYWGYVSFCLITMRKPHDIT